MGTRVSLFNPRTFGLFALCGQREKGNGRDSVRRRGCSPGANVKHVPPTTVEYCPGRRSGPRIILAWRSQVKNRTLELPVNQIVTGCQAGYPPGRPCAIVVEVISVSGAEADRLASAEIIALVRPRAMTQDRRSVHCVQTACRRRPDVGIRAAGVNHANPMGLRKQIPRKEHK